VQLAEDLIRLSGFEPADIPITFSGLRPGEKLEESLWEHGADVQDTANPDVWQVVEPQSISSARLSALIESLAEAAVHGDREVITKSLRDLIPTFQPLPSRDSANAPG
jgi:FlaA1/EpsC-like NDP-sugar epimerase